MKIVRVTPETAPLYVEYGIRLGGLHDESFLPPGNFIPNPDYPSFLLYREFRGKKRMVGAAGLMLTPSYRDAGRGRVTVLHTTEGGYRALLAYRHLTRALRQSSAMTLYGFLPESLKQTRLFWRLNGWKEERRSYLLANHHTGVPDDTPPEGFRWDFAAPGNFEKLETWRGLVNRNFEHLAGHVELTSEHARAFAGAPGNLGEGLTILDGPDGPAGTLQAEVDDDDPTGSFLGAISLNRSLRGRGLGRLILRRGLALSRRAGLCPTWLVVNAENERAVALYESEGFVREKVMVCYALPPR